MGKTLLSFSTQFFQAALTNALFHQCLKSFSKSCLIMEVKEPISRWLLSPFDGMVSRQKTRQFVADRLHDPDGMEIFDRSQA
jgi:hypothetical protein